MAGDGGGRVLGEHPAGTTSGRGNIPSILRGARRVLSPGGPDNHPRLHRAGLKAGKKPATVRRYIATIGRAHIGAGLLNPCSGEAVRLALKKMGRETSARQDQAHPLGWKEIKEFIGSAGEGLRADRERALLCVAYETLARRGELVGLKVRDIEFWPNGTGQAIIRRGKTDAEGQGRVAYLSRETVKRLKIWLVHAKISERPIFRRLIGRDEIGDALHPGSIAPIFKRVAQWIGMPARFVAEVSGHSTRVGAAQDLAELDIDLAAITQAGGWKSPRMPLQYAEKINAARSGMARAAAATGRDQAVSVQGRAPDDGNREPANTVVCTTRNSVISIRRFGQ
jgi:integrase